MKAERKEEEKWVPIVITLESKEEAQYLYHCLFQPVLNIQSKKGMEVDWPSNSHETSASMFSIISGLKQYFQ